MNISEITEFFEQENKSFSIVENTEIILKELNNHIVTHVEFPNIEISNGIISFFIAINKLGYTIQVVSTKEKQDLGMFGRMAGISGDYVVHKPRLTLMSISQNDTISIPYGLYFISEIDSYIELGSSKSEYVSCLLLKIYTSSKQIYLIDRIKHDIENTAKNINLYKNSPIELSSDSGMFGKVSTNIKFLNLNLESDLNIYLNQDTIDDINNNIMKVITHKKELKDKGINIKRGAIFKGGFGTGKTTLCNKIARIATENNWCFIYIKDYNSNNFEDYYKAAMKFSPAIIYFEDIDFLIKERNNRTNSLVNIMDGIESKNRDIITIFTTNNVGNIPKVLLRPGRIDTIINFGNLEEEPLKKMISHYLESSLEYPEDTYEECITYFTKKLLELDLSPAFAKEAIVKAKLIGFNQKDNTITISKSIIKKSIKMIKNSFN